jgi:hypothetical protein
MSKYDLTDLVSLKPDEQQYAIDAFDFDPDTEMHDVSDEEEDVEDELSTVEGKCFFMIE